MLRYLIKLFSAQVAHTIKEGPRKRECGMGKKSCGKQCCLSCASTFCQMVCAIGFILLCFYFASVALTPVRILGITQLPPGIKYAEHDSRF